MGLDHLLLDPADRPERQQRESFGNFEYCFSTLKIAAIVAFILLGAYLVFGSANPAYGVHNYSAHGGFFPHGLKGMWIAVVVSIFSYLSVEMIAVAAAEAEHPEQAVKSAFRSTIVRLVVFYLLTLALMLAIVPLGPGRAEPEPVRHGDAGDQPARRHRSDELRGAGGRAVGDEQPALHHHPDDVQPVARGARAEGASAN